MCHFTDGQIDYMSAFFQSPDPHTFIQSVYLLAHPSYMNEVDGTGEKDALSVAMNIPE